MLGYAFDERRLAFVAMLLGQEAVIADHDRLVSAIHDFGNLAVRRPATIASAIICVGTPGAPAERHRKAIVETTDRVRRVRLAFVSGSIVARGINMGINLLGLGDPETVRSVHSSLDEALLWFEGQQAGSSTFLRRLIEQARITAR